MFIIYEYLVNSAVKIGPRLKRRQRHRHDIKDPVYKEAYREAFLGKVESDHAGGQVFMTAIIMVMIIVSAVLWLVNTLISHDPLWSPVSGLMFWGFVIGLIFQAKYYHKIQDYSIELAQKAIRDDKIARDKAQAAADKAAADKTAREIAESNAKRAAAVKKAKAVRKAAEKKPAQPVKATSKSNTGTTGMKIDGF